MIVNVNGAVVVVTPVVDTNAYAAGDLIGDKLTLSQIIPVGNNYGILQTVVLADRANQKAPIDLVFFRLDPGETNFTDNAPLAIDDADLFKIIGVYSITAADYVSFAANALATVKPSLEVVAGDGRSLYLCLVARGAVTFASDDDLQLTLLVV